MSTKTLLSADELEQKPADDSGRRQLGGEELITMAPAGPGHRDYEGNIVILLKNYVRKHRLGKVYSGDVGFRLRDDTVRAPDVAFVRRERVPAVQKGGFGKGAPDLAVEIFSPSDSVRQLMRKVK